MNRNSPARIREWVEGVDYWWHGSAHRLNAHTIYAKSRCKEGLGMFRRAWWIHSRLESYRTFRRYALLLDWALAEPGFRQQKDVIPRNSRMIVFRLGHLGDMLHLLPTLRQIRSQRPDVRIELVTGPWNKGLLVGQNNLLNAVHYFTPDVFQYNRGQKFGVRSMAEEKQFIRELRGSGVDLVFCPSIPHFSELPFIVGLQPSHYVGGEWPLSELPVATEFHTRPFDSRYYELDSVADFLPLMGLERKPVSLEYHVAAATESKCDALIKNENPYGYPMVSIFPGSGWPGKCWSPEHFSELLNRWSSGADIFVALGGSPGERELCESIKKCLRAPAANLAGRLTLDESAAVIKQSILLIGNDSAPIHIAAAVGCPTISLWGPTFPEKWAPRGEQHKIVVRREQCAGCHYWHPAASCHGTPPCMTSISVDEVFSAVDELGLLQALPA